MVHIGRSFDMLFICNQLWNSGYMYRSLMVTLLQTLTEQSVRDSENPWRASFQILPGEVRSSWNASRESFPRHGGARNQVSVFFPLFASLESLCGAPSGRRSRTHLRPTSSPKKSRVPRIWDEIHPNVSTMLQHRSAPRDLWGCSSQYFEF